MIFICSKDSFVYIQYTINCGRLKYKINIGLNISNEMEDIKKYLFQK